MPLERASTSKNYKSLTAYFITPWRTPYHEVEQFTVHFNDKGYLCALDLTADLDRKTRSFSGLEADTERGGT
jgi:hypothetical protein